MSKINVYDKIMIGNQKKKRKYGNQRNILHKFDLIDCPGMEFTACIVQLIPEGALTSFTICDTYSYFVGHA